jgi:hypothetical protein
VVIVVFDAIPVHQLSAVDEYLHVLSVSCPHLDESRRSFHMLSCNEASDPLCPSRIAVTAIAGPRVSEWVAAVSIGTVLGGGLFGCLILPSPLTFFFGCWVAAIGSLPVFGGFTVVAWLLRGVLHLPSVRLILGTLCGFSAGLLCTLDFSANGIIAAAIGAGSALCAVLIANSLHFSDIHRKAADRV